MNIFVLDIIPEKAAQYHCDKHCSKMILEQTQIMCTILNELGYQTEYLSTHKNHPCNRWARESLSNYLWLRELTLELHKEFQYRYGRTHKSGLVAESLPIPDIKDYGLTDFAMAMPEKYHEKNYVNAYRNYYLGEKSALLKYTKREMPDWVLNKIKGEN